MTHFHFCVFVCVGGGEGVKVVSPVITNVRFGVFGLHVLQRTAVLCWWLCCVSLFNEGPLEAGRLRETDTSEPSAVCVCLLIN